jgi:hypothetical protein
MWPPPVGSELTTLQRSYRRRRNVNAALFATALLYWLGFLLQPDAIQGRATEYFYGWVALVILLGLVSPIVWRCPRCGAVFGRRLRVARCPECRLALELGDDPHDSAATGR